MIAGQENIAPGKNACSPEASVSPLLQTQGIVKRFPGVIANAGIDFGIGRGEIHTVLGENGAGKTTLLNILSGMLQPDQGKIFFNGREVVLGSPRQALREGIGAVYQHFTLVPTLSVIENIILGQPFGFVVNLRRAEQQLQPMLKQFNLAGFVRQEVRYLSLGQQQRVEIVKALYRGSKLLLLDEPTSILAPAEVEELFAILRQLKQEDVAVLFITHKLDEALSLSDRITVLRQGRCAGQFGRQELAPAHRAATVQRIVESMFGGPPSQANEMPATERTVGAPILVLQKVSVPGEQNRPAIREISLELRAGEILGIAGVEGSGQKELAEVIAGQRSPSGGRILFKDKDVSHSRAALHSGPDIGYVTDDRLGEGSVPGMSVAENLVMKVINRQPFSRGFLVDRAAIENHAQQLIETFDIKAPGPWARTATLSGGNLQKLLLARELAFAPSVLICNKPTQGLDVKTTRFIWRTLRAQAGDGTAILLFSLELDELLALSDRIGVLYNGRLLDVLTRDKASRERLGRLMLGKR